MPETDKSSAADKVLVRAMVVKMFKLLDGPVTPETIGDQWMVEMLAALADARRAERDLVKGRVIAIVRENCPGEGIDEPCTQQPLIDEIKEI